MRRYRGRDGSDCLWYDAGEVEDLMESELSRAGLMPTLDNPIVNVESFVELHLQAQFDPYAPLDSAVLGETTFRVGAPHIVSINKDLTGAALDEDDSPLGLRGRWRATVAHEASHVLLHRCLFDLTQGQGLLFAVEEQNTPEANRLQRCLKRDVVFGALVGDWREIQANMGMAALLMPRRVFAAAFHLEMNALGLQRVERGSAHVATLAGKLSTRFQVSRQAAGIRLHTLELLAQIGQTDLLG